MARTTMVIVEDDLDGGPADQQITFTLDGAEYEIDLNNSNADRFRKLLDPYVTNGRRTGGRQRRNAAAARRSSSDELHDIREWARANGHTVSDRGRISQVVRDAYAAAAHK